MTWKLKVILVIVFVVEMVERKCTAEDSSGMSKSNRICRHFNVHLNVLRSTSDLLKTDQLNV